MREILFRGKPIHDRSTLEWIEGGIKTKDGRAFIIGMSSKMRVEAMEVDPDTVGQYTGMTDRNGQKIFEGDIVEDGRDYNEEDGYGVVEWNDGAFEVISEGNWSGTFYTNYYGYEFEVIGNIHDNPDLLKGE